jgi:hypothetical protein
MAVLFPDVEKILIAFLKQSLPEDVYVSVKKPAPEAQASPKQVIVNLSYNQERWFVTKLCSLTLECYAESYDDANALGLLTEALIRESVGEVVKRVTVRLGPVRTTEEGQQERRSLDVELVIAGSNL